MTPTETLPAINQPASIEVSEKQAAAWLSMARAKNELARSLTAMELQAQGILLPVKDSQDYKAIDAAIAEYKKLGNEIQATRLAFTSKIEDGLIKPLMSYEKRVKDDPIYAELTARSVTLRKDEANKALNANLKNSEIARFKAHVENEGFRVAAAYRALLRTEITTQYRIFLKAKERPNLDELKEVLREAISVPRANKFNTTILSGEEMLAVYETLRKPDYSAIYEEMMVELDKTFANFASDIANAEEAVKHTEEQVSKANAAEAQHLAQEVAINTLMNTAEAVVVEGPKLKKTLQIERVDTGDWVKAVLAAFMLYMPQLLVYIRVKSWENLSVGQMADALGKLATAEGITFNNLQLTEVCK